MNATNKLLAVAAIAQQLYATSRQDEDPVKFIRYANDIKPNVKPVAELIDLNCHNAGGEACMRPDTRIVFMDYDPWPQYFSMPRSGSSGETDADADTDENFSASLKIPTMIVETTTLANLTYKKDITIHKKDRIRQSS